MTDGDGQGEDAAEQRRNSKPWLVPHRFRPGQSGNPNGRPRGTGLSDRLRKILDETVDGQTVAERLVQAGVDAAVRGDFRFWRYIFDRVEGKVPDCLIFPEQESVDQGAKACRILGAQEGGVELMEELSRRLNDGDSVARSNGTQPASGHTQ